MSALKKVKMGIFEIEEGADVVDVINEAIELSVKRHRPVTFEFDSVSVTVTGISNPELVYQYWQNAVGGISWMELQGGER